jgi:hypothetical protein
VTEGTHNLQSARYSYVAGSEAEVCSSQSEEDDAIRARRTVTLILREQMRKIKEVRAKMR